MKKNMRMTNTHFFCTNMKPRTMGNYKGDIVFDPLIITRCQNPYNTRKRRHEVVIIQRVRQLDIDSSSNSERNIQLSNDNNELKGKINVRRERAKTRINCSVDYKRAIQFSSRNKDAITLRSPFNGVRNPYRTKNIIKTPLSRYKRLHDYLKDLFVKSQVKANTSMDWNKKPKKLNHKTASEVKRIILRFDDTKNIEVPKITLRSSEKFKKVLKLRWNQKALLDKYKKICMN